jgi:hypothetical protein
MAKTVNTTWEVWTYDVWGNATDGYDVNDRNCVERAYPLRLKAVLNNAGKSGEFVSAYPSDYQLQRLFGVACKLDTDGDDTSIYVRRASDGYPIGELTCTSHESLSPIRQTAGSLDGAE